jgi:hypothetical protein
MEFSFQESRKGYGMDKTIVGLLGGVSALALMGGAECSPAVAAQADSMQPARSYAELLDPIPNAIEQLKADNQRAAGLELVQYYAPYHHHHHHHHHYRRYYYGFYPHPYHHHHHHHHHQLVIPLPE